MQYFPPQYQTSLLTPSSTEYSVDRQNQLQLLSAKPSLSSMNSSNSSESSAKSIKRRRSSSASANKLKKNDLTDNQENEWPTYNHPQGGFIQFTPWGNIRKMIVDGVEITKFEDGDQDITRYIPDSPVSMVNESYHNNNGSASDQRLSNRINSDGEVESYLIEGYQKQYEQDILDETFYQHEHENYFGMDANQDKDVDNDYEMS